MKSGLRSRQKSWTGLGSRGEMTNWGCGRWRSGTRRITFTSWRLWPGRTAGGRGSGTTSTGFGRHAGRRRSNSGCGRPPRRIAPRRDGPRGPRPSRRVGADGKRRRVTLWREVCTAAAAAATEHEFFERLHQAGVLVRLRASTTNRGEITGYSVGLAAHSNRDGGVVWYGGGKLAADLTLPKLRRRWNPRSRAAQPPALRRPPNRRSVFRKRRAVAQKPDFCQLCPARPDDKLMTNDLQASPGIRELACDL